MKESHTCCFRIGGVRFFCKWFDFDSVLGYNYRVNRNKKGICGMQQVFSTTLNQMICFFIIMIIGFILCKLKCLNENTDVVISKLLSTVIMPVLIFQTFVSKLRVEVLAQKLYIFLIGAVIATLSYLLARLLAKVFAKDKYLQNIYTYSFAVSNLGYMGIPLVKAVFGDDVLFDMMVFTVPFHIYIYSIGLASLNPNHPKVTLKSFANPVFGGMIFGGIVGLSGITLPSAVLSVTTMISNCMSPLPMIVAGVVIAKYQIKSLLYDYKIYIAVILRLIVLPLFFVFVIKLLGCNQSILLLAMCSLAMPMGLNTIVFPSAYGGDTRPGASMALISNILGIITIPVMIAMIM